MLRNRAVALLLCWLVSPGVLALGLGPLEASSALNEPFKGRIEVLGAKPEDFETLTAGLAGEEQFQRAGIDRPAVLFKLRFSLDETAKGGKDYITVTSSDPIREPFLNFLLEMNWSNGRLVREYTVLLDPPLYDPNRRQVPAAVAGAGRPAAVAQPAMATTAGSVPPAPGAVALPPKAAGGDIGPVGSTDTLWSLAAASRPDSSVTIQQMMLALLRQNPEAFSNGNVNMLRRGAVLHLPDDPAIRAISVDQALAEVRKQHQLWEEYRQQIGASPATQPLGTTAPAAAAALVTKTGSAAHITPAPAADAHLEVVAPGGTDTGGGKPGKGTTGGNSELLREQLDATAQQAGDIKSKLAEADKLIDLLQRQVNIKDQELAALQTRLAELGVKTGAATSAPPAPIAPGTSAGAAETPAPASAEGTATDSHTTEPSATPAASDAPTSETATTAVPGGDGAEAPTAAVKPEEEKEIVVNDSAPPPATGSPGFPASLIPSALADSVPGGALTVLAAAVLVVLSLLGAIARKVLKSGGAQSAAPVVTPVPAQVFAGIEDATITAPTAAAGGDDESESPTVFDPARTVEAQALAPGEATIQPGAAAQDESDPLEEVNVYLAYERFDQAEDLVKRVIAQHPDRHDFKLRLLEVYYSSNDRVQYEKVARELFDAVGESSTLWESALAMWAEMSPERALFAEGAALPAAAPEAATAFVDITGDNTDSGAAESTVSFARGGRDSTLDLDLALGAEAAEDAEVIDLTAGADVLDLTAASDDFGSVLDLTAADNAESFDLSGTELLDLTASEDSGDGLLDITGGVRDHSGMLDIAGDDEDSSGMLDITGGSDAGGDLLDITGGADSNDFLDISIGHDMPAARGSDLLDVTRIGDISLVGDDHDLLNVTSPGLRVPDDAAPSASSALDLDIGHDLTGARADTGAEDSALAFDISDTVAPAFGAAIDGGDDDGDGLDLDFDIGGLESDDVPTVELNSAVAGTAIGDGDLDLDLTMGEGGDGDLDFDITMSADDLSSALSVSEREDAAGGLEITMGSLGNALDGELSLQGTELDALALDDGTGLDDDFDFALDGGNELNPIAADDTLDMSGVALTGVVDLEVGDGASLDDLTLELDSALVRGANTGIGTDDDLLDTVAIDFSANDLQDNRNDQTILLPGSDAADRESDADEADTKLNLAKAYIELGDSEGARSILDEVTIDGTPAQQAEARTLLGQLQA